MKKTMKKNLITTMSVCGAACLCFGLFSALNAKNVSALDDTATEIAFSETKLNVSQTGDKMLIVTAINHAEFIENVYEIGYEIDGYTVTENDFAETDKYYSTITLAAGEAKKAEQLGFTGATETSKLLIWEVAYNPANNYEISAYAKLLGDEKTVTGTPKTNTFTVTFHNEDEAVATQKVNYNGTTDLESVSEFLVAKNGYECKWVTEDGADFTETTLVKKDTTVNIQYTGIKLDKQEAEAQTEYMLVGETLSMPTDVAAAESEFYQNEYTLTWTFGEREVSGESFALTADEVGTETESKQTLLVCTAAKADGSDEHVVYEQAYNVYKIREEHLEPIYVTGTGNVSGGGVHILFGTHDNATDGAIVSAVMDGNVSMLPGKITSHSEGKFYSQTGYYENGSHNLVVRCEKKIVYQTINRADGLIDDLGDFDWYQANRTNLYLGLAADITFGAPNVSNKVFGEWATTFYQVLKNSIDGFGHSINAEMTGEMHLSKVTDGQDNPFTGIFENINDGITLKNIQFNLNLTLPCVWTRIIGNLNEGATIDNCVFNVNANNDIKANVDSTDDGWGKDHQWGEALFGNCAGTVKNSLFINTGLNNYQFALNATLALPGNRAAHVENCVFVNWASVGRTSGSGGEAVYYFPVATNENTKFWVFNTLENAVNGTFANVSGYGTAPSDGGASFSQENAKGLAEILADSYYLTVDGTTVLWNGVAL